MQRIEACVIGVAAVHDVDGAGLGHDQIERVDVTHFSVRDVDEGRDVAAQIEQRVHLHGGLCALEVRPREHRQAQVDRRGIEREDGALEIEAEIVVDVKPPRLRDQSLRQLGMDAPVPRLVRVGQRGATNGRAKSHGVELARLGLQTGLDVAQALAVGQLCERHRSILLGAGERADAMVAAIAQDQTLERAPWQKVHQLGEQRLACVHGSLPGKFRGRMPWATSNRHHAQTVHQPL